jgi:hypothetical protein
MTPGQWVRDLPSLLDFTSYVIVYAPDEFPFEDDLPTHEQMTLETAFAALQHGVGLLGLPTPRTQALHTLLNTAQRHYESGNDVAGAHVLHDFEHEVRALTR